MSWDTEIVALTRNYIGDTDTVSPKYTDAGLKALVLSAAQFVTFDVALSQDYIPDVVSLSLTPDPTSRATSTSRDNAFINLTVLKACWMIANGELIKYASQAIAIRDGTSMVDLKRDLRALADLLKQYENAYFEYKDRYVRDNLNTGQIITTPIRLYSGNGGFSYGGPYYRWDRY